MGSTLSRDTIGPEFNPFLRTQLWEEGGGGRLSLLSALARLGLDPWGEAADLARLPRPVAAARLADLLARLPGTAPETERETACRRSVSLLPVAGPPTVGAGLSAASVDGGSPHPPALSMLVLALWIGALLTMTLLDARPAATTGAQAAATQIKAPAVKPR